MLARREVGNNARLSSFVGAMAIADLVKTTLYPKGMDKILQSVSDAKNALVTNDGDYSQVDLTRTLRPRSSSTRPRRRTT